MRKEYLLTPGPTSIPPEVLLAMAQPIVHHRAPEYIKLFEEVRNDLKYVFQTNSEVLIFASSGTGGMEGAVVNTLSAGDKALVIRGGKFGERWGKICQAYGVNALNIDVEWGYPVEPQIIADALRKDPSIKAVFTQQCETSTGVINDIETIAKIVSKTEAILVVDAVSSLGVMDLPMDKWQVDVVTTGSQKALMLPPGLAFVGVSEKAWRMVEKSTLPKFYFNFKSEKKNIEKNQNAFTPAVSLITGLKKSLDMIRAEGLENVFTRHERLARATRAGMEALGLEVFSKAPSPSLTAVCAPEGINADDIVKKFSKVHAITIAGGQDHLKGKIFRISHMGYASSFDVVTAISALEMTLGSLGYPVDLGAGMKAAEKILMEA